MKERVFSFEKLIENIEGFKGEEHDASTVEQHKRIMKMMDVFFSEAEARDDFLDAYTLQDFEWFADLMNWWPTYEMDPQENDFHHVGIQRIEIFHAVTEAPFLKPIKKKVTFL
jgi:hypothetical protein